MTKPDEDLHTLPQQLHARLADGKALDVVLLDLRGRAAFADFFLVATGTSRTHVASLADEVDRFFHERGQSILHKAGLPEATWVVVDAANVVVHLFQKEARAFYDLERLWSLQSRPKAVDLPKEEILVS